MIILFLYVMKGNYDSGTKQNSRYKSGFNFYDVEVEVDGEAVPAGDIRFSADGGEHWFTLAEMETVTFFRWEYEDEATVRVLRPGGLGPGEHEVLLRVSVRVAYIPVPFSGEMTRTVAV